MNWRRAFIFALAAWGGLLMFTEPLAGVAMLLVALVVAILTEPVV